MRTQPLMFVRLMFIAVIAGAALLPASVGATDALHWPMPWKAGDVWIYETENINEEQQGSQHQKLRITDTSEMRIAQSSAQDIVQTWTSTATKVETLAGDPKQTEDTTLLYDAMTALPIEVALDSGGHYLRVRNIDTVSERLRDATRKILRKGSLAAIEQKVWRSMTEAQRKQAMIEIDANIKPVLELITNPTVTERFMAQSFTNFNRFVGVDLQDGGRYRGEGRLDVPELATSDLNAIHGKDHDVNGHGVNGDDFNGYLPSVIEFGMTVSKDDPEDVFLIWNEKINPGKGRDAAWKASEKTGGRHKPESERIGLPSDLSIIEEGAILFHRPTGAIEMFESTRTTIIGGQVKHERARMRLTNGGHQHQWRDTPSAASLFDTTPSTATPAAAPRKNKHKGTRKQKR